MSIVLLDNPSIYHRDGNAVIIFPSRPYWFSATSGVEVVMEAFKLSDPLQIIEQISTGLKLPELEAREIFDDVSELLFEAGILEVNGTSQEPDTFSPDFQVNDVENVMVIATTQGCNMTCPMCYAHARRPMQDEMDTWEIKAIVDKLAKMPWKNGISRVALTGGELFTRPDALELIDYVYKQGYFVQVNTNATLIDDNHIRELVQYRDRLKMSISLDGARAKSHEAIRGEGTFATTVWTINELTRQGISVAVNMFVHAGNIDEMGDTIDLADSIGACGFNALNMMHVGRGNTTKTKQLLEAVPLARFYRALYEVIRDDPRRQQLTAQSTFANQIMGIAGGVKSHGCGIGTNRAVYVKANGDLFPCADTAIPAFCLGNLRTDDLAQIWNESPILAELRTLDVDTMNQECAACDVRYMCGGNCRGENFQTTQDIHGPHFKCKEIHESIIELMWILTENPDLFRGKVDGLMDTITNTHATSA